MKLLVFGEIKKRRIAVIRVIGFWRKAKPSSGTSDPIFAVYFMSKEVFCQGLIVLDSRGKMVLNNSVLQRTLFPR
jgi:hypothetical protein